MKTVQVELIRSRLAVQVETLKCAIALMEESTSPVMLKRTARHMTGSEAVDELCIRDAALHTARRKLLQLEHALARVDYPNFGRCVVCCGTISFERLMETPSTNQCERCSLVAAG